MKKLLTIALIFCVIAVIGLFVAKKVAVGYLTPDFLVRKIESTWNCRAQVDSLDVSLLGTTGVELKGVYLAPRDSYVVNATPLKDRPPVENSLIHSESILLNVELKDLLARRLNIALLRIGETNINGTVFSDGKSDLEMLFDAPGESTIAYATSPDTKPIEDLEEARAAEPAQPTVTEGLAVVDPPSLAEPKVEPIESTTDEVPLSTVADTMELENATVSILLESSGARIDLQNLKIGLSEIDINPSGLDQHNRAVFAIESDLTVKNAALTEEYFISHLSGTGEIFPFDAATGEMNPSWVCDATIHQGAQFNTLPLVEKINEKLSQVDAGGVDLGDFQLGGVLLDDAATRIAAKDGRFEFETPLTLQLAEASVGVREESWVDTASNQHQVNGVIIASQATTDDIEAKLAIYLKDKTGGFLNSENLVDLVLGPVKQDGRLAFNYTSKGDLSDPKADILTPFGSLTEVMSGGKDTLKDLEKAGKALLKGLFGN